MESLIRTDSIISWEDEFGMDINGDNDFSGTVSINTRSTDTTLTSDGIVLGTDVEGALWITDGNTNIQINENWIEQENFWDDGGFTSIAIAVTKNNNDTIDNIQDDYYQLAVKQSHIYTDWFTGEQNTSEDWQIYAIDSSGNLDSSKTLFTQSIQNFEENFGQDLDSNGSIGLDVSSLLTQSIDTYGYRLLKNTCLLYTSPSPRDS